MVIHAPDGLRGMDRIEQRGRGRKREAQEGGGPEAWQVEKSMKFCLF